MRLPMVTTSDPSRGTTPGTIPAARGSSQKKSVRFRARCALSWVEPPNWKEKGLGSSPAQHPDRDRPGARARRGSAHPYRQLPQIVPGDPGGAIVVWENERTDPTDDISCAAGPCQRRPPFWIPNDVPL